MVAGSYEISLLVLKNISLLCCAHSWNIFSTLGEKLCISAQPSNIPHHYPMEGSIHSLNNWGLVPIILFAGQGYCLRCVMYTVPLSNHGLCLERYRVSLLLPCHNTSKTHSTKDNKMPPSAPSPRCRCSIPWEDLLARTWPELYDTYIRKAYFCPLRKPAR